MESASLKFREATVKAKPLPRHIGIIMDGNGRWAEGHGRPRLEGHREGSNSVREVTRCARRTGLEALTLYAFSSQNWQRPSLEVAGLMELLREYLLKERREILDNQIRLNAIGELKKLPEYVREPLEALREESAGNTGMTLTLALSYGGREELVRAMRAVAAKVEAGELVAESITNDDIERELWTTDLPPVDLIVRTSGENRVSNFLLWQGAYAEYVFTETLWPDFRAHELLDCIEQFQNRERRFGLTSAQLRAIP
ncbi:MAG: di-trans,poly-cis-decaprenylcistransferase [Archangiaceae bacterium]|nr:di-trans,poly-cis-decaprenylcistransferase [Archangiaceae bacterium]